MRTRIRIKIDRQKVQGEITHRSANDITVKITKPYQGVSRGMHLPHFAASHKRFDRAFGDKVAKDLLKNIYHLCKFVFENIHSLTDRFLRTKKRIKFLELQGVSEWVFKGRKLQLRKLLRDGKIDNLEYQKRLTSLRKAYEKFAHKRDLIWNGFFDEYFPMIVPVNTRADVLRILENKMRPTVKEPGRVEFKSSGTETVMIKRVLPGNAYFIHPYRGQVIYVPHSHISLVISNPEKFRLNFEYIKTIYEKYGERIGLEGRARREILLHLIDRGFIRIRKYKNHWKVNVKDLHSAEAAIYLHRWAKSILAETNDFHIEVIIDQKNRETIKTDLKTLASYQFAGRPKGKFQAMAYVPGPFLMIDEVEPGSS
jgi:hypothetical protein